MIKADASFGALVRRSRILECLSLGDHNALWVTYWQRSELGRSR